MTDRGPDGKFIKGKPGGPGRPPHATEQEYLGVFKATIPLERFAKIVEAQARRAEKGDQRAADLIFKYILPLVQKSEHTGEGGGAILVRVEYVGDNDNG